VILDKGCRARRQAARAGTRGRRGARRVAPCPLYVVTVRNRLSEDERRALLEMVDRLPRPWLFDTVHVTPMTDGDVVLEAGMVLQP
jgi:hypothetical protein